MPRPLKITLSILLGIPLLFIVGIVIFFSVNDANNFKPTIETKAKDLAGINLKINGNLSWSLFPLGINIDQLQVQDQQYKDFASIKQIIAEVSLFSLLDQKPRVQNILLDGLKLDLIQTSPTEANWNNLLPKKEDAAKNETTNTPAPKPGTTAKKGNNKIDFLVKSFELRNAQVHFISQTKAPDSQQDINLNNINLKLSNIALDKSFPFTFNFELKDKNNDLSLLSTISSKLKISNNFKSITVENLESEYQLSSPKLLKDLPQQPLLLKFNTDLTVNTETESLTINRFSAIVNELAVSGNASINDYSKQLKAKGQLNIETFSLHDLLQKLGIKLPEMQDTKALSQTGFKTDFSVKDDKLSLANIIIQLDSSHWQGDVQFGLKDQAITAILSGDELNIDNYLPPASQNIKTESTNTEGTDIAKTEPPKVSPKESNANSPLLPIEALRALKLDITFTQQKLIAHALETTNIAIKVAADKGRLSLTSLNGKLYDGEYSLSALIDAKTDTPIWTSQQNIKNVNLGALLKSLPEVKAQPKLGMISGLLNFDATAKSKGNTVENLSIYADAKTNFSLKDGAIEEISLNAMACQGFALINGDTVNTDNWPQRTPFKTLKGDATLKNQLANTNLDIVTSGIQVDGQGKIDLKQSNLDLRAALRVIGDLGEQACRVNQRVKDIAIPIKCTGSFDTPPAELCGLDSKRLGKEVANLAKKEGERQVKKQVDKAVDKYLGQDSEKNKKLKNILNKLF